MTIDQVREAKLALEEEGKPVSYNAVLKRLGKGSKRDVAHFMQQLIVVLETMDTDERVASDRPDPALLPPAAPRHGATPVPEEHHLVAASPPPPDPVPVAVAPAPREPVAEAETALAEARREELRLAAQQTSLCVERRELISTMRRLEERRRQIDIALEQLAPEHAQAADVLLACQRDYREKKQQAATQALQARRADTLWT